MKWRSSGISSIQVGGKCIPVKTLILGDRWGQQRRVRVRTVHLGEDSNRSLSPCWGQLAKDERELIGVLVVGAHHTGQVRVGSGGPIVPHLFVSLDALSQVVRRRILIPVDYEIIVEDEAVLARERQPSSWYVASRGSTLFHEAGCTMAQRIREENRIVFQTRQEAFSAGFYAHQACIA